MPRPVVALRRELPLAPTQIHLHRRLSELKPRWSPHLAKQHAIDPPGILHRARRGRRHRRLPTDHRLGDQLAVAMDAGVDEAIPGAVAAVTTLGSVDMRASISSSGLLPPAHHLACCAM